MMERVFAKGQRWRWQQMSVLLPFAVWCLAGVVPPARAGIIMEPLVLPAAEQALATFLEKFPDRYGGGWLALDKPIPPVRLGRETVLFPFGPGVLVDLLPPGTIWDSAPAGGLSALDRLLLGWALRLPPYPEGPIRLPLHERMLWVPSRLRIELMPLAE